MPILRQDITIYQGSKFEGTFTVEYLDDDGAVQPFDLTGYDARFVAKEKLTDTTKVIELDSDTIGGVTVDDVNGLIAVTLDADDVADLDFISAGYNLEIFTSDAAEDSRIAQGILTLSKEYAT